MSCLLCDGMCGFHCWYWECGSAGHLVRVSLVDWCGCRCWRGTVESGRRGSYVPWSGWCGLHIVGMRDVVCVGRGGGCRGVTDVGVIGGGGRVRNCIGCGG